MIYLFIYLLLLDGRHVNAPMGQIINTPCSCSLLNDERTIVLNHVVQQNNYICIPPTATQIHACLYGFHQDHSSSQLQTQGSLPDHITKSVKEKEIYLVYQYKCYNG